MTIHLYFARKFLWLLLGISGVFFVLMALIDLMEQFRRFDVDEVGFDAILKLTLLRTPEGLYQLLPLIIILATVSLFISLSRTSELVVVRASGRSAILSLLSPVAVALLVGIFAVSTLNPLVAATSVTYSQLSDDMRSDGRSALSLSSEGIWLRQGGALGQAVIHAAQTNVDASEFREVTFVIYAPDGGPQTRIEAESAILLEGAWELRKAKAWPLLAGINSEENSKSHDTLRVESSLTPDQIRDRFGSPAAISIWDLPRFINDLEEAGFSARRHTVWLHMEFAQPLFLMAMVLIASVFTMRHTRFGNTGVAVLASLLIGFTLYFIRNFAKILGDSGQIPIELAAWAPPVASILLALGLLLHMEDG